MGANDDKKAVQIQVPAEPATTDDKDKDPEDKPKEEGAGEETEPTKPKRKVDAKKKKAEANELSEEDRKHKEELELLVVKIVRSTNANPIPSLTEKLEDANSELAEKPVDVAMLTPEEQYEEARKALEVAATELKAATSSMTSVPKPLKFLRPHYSILEEHYKQIPDSLNKRHLADVLSVLATTVISTSAETQRPLLRYCLAGTCENLPSWGHEYLRNLSGEIASEFTERQRNEQSTDELIPLIDEIVPFNMKHHAEWDAIDLLCEVERIEEIKKYIYDDDSCQRVVLYLVNAASYTATVEEYSRILTVATEILYTRNRFCSALRVAFRLQSSSLINKVIQLAAESYRHTAAKARELIKTQQEDSASNSIGEKQVDVDVKMGQASRDTKESDDTRGYKGEAVEGKDIVDEAKLRWSTLKQMALLCTRQRIDYDWESVDLVPTGYGSEDNHCDGVTDDLVAVTTGNPVVAKETASTEGSSGDAKVMNVDEEGETESRKDHLVRMARGEHLSEFYGLLAKELDVVEPKNPEDVYKTALEERRSVTSIESAKVNLAATIVNAFVNIGFRNDNLMLVEGSPFLYKNKDHGMMSASASLGALVLWNMQDALANIDKFLYASDTNILGGALMAFGIAQSGVRSELDPVYPLLSEYLQKPSSETDVQVRIGTVLGLGLAYAGTCKSELLDDMVPIIIESSVKVSAMCSLALGFAYVGSCHECVADAILQTLDDRQSSGGLDNPNARFYGVALGLVFLTKRDACDAVIAALSAVDHPVARYAAVTVEGCAFAGTGDVIRIQKMLQKCVETSQPSDKEKAGGTEGSKEGGEAGGDPQAAGATTTGTGTAAAAAPSSSSSTGANAVTQGSGASGGGSGSGEDDKEGEQDKLDQAVAVLSLPLIALGEEIGSDMCVRMMDHLLQYADLPLRRAVPLALALYCCSNPAPAIVDTLSKLSHDFDVDVALHAIIALGIVGAGTNNSRVAQLLRQLASFYQKDPNGVFAVRLAQGLLYMGKGLVTISPLHSDRLLVPPVALGAIVVVLHACLSFTDTILSQQHYLMYFLAAAVYPRMLFTVDEDMKPLPVSVRVGQAVDVVAQAGNPRTITGFQTHNTPVLLSHGDRAELATDEYVPLTPILEGVVILRKNPNYKPAKA